MASAVAVFPEPGRAETTTFWVRDNSTTFCCSGDGVNEFGVAKVTRLVKLRLVDASFFPKPWRVANRSKR